MKSLLVLLLFIPVLLVGGTANGSPTGAPVKTGAFGLIAGGTVANGQTNKTAIQNAVNALGSTGGTVVIPCGFYYVDPGIVVNYKQKNITVEGCANGFAYDLLSPTVASYQGGTVIAWAKSGPVGFDLSQIDNTNPAGNYTRLANMVLVGTAARAVKTCVKASGIVQLSNLDVEGCTDYGIWLYEFINETTLDHVSSNGNRGGTGIGLMVGPGGPSFRDNTLFRVSNSVFRRNTVGVRIEQAMNYLFDHFVFESNDHEGLILFRQHTPAVTIDGGGAKVGAGHDLNAMGIFNTGNIENNSASDDAHAQVLIDAATPSRDTIDTPSHITFENVIFSPYETTVPGRFKTNINIKSGQFINFRNSELNAGDPVASSPSKSPVILGTNSSYVQFYNIRGNPVFTNAGLHNSTHDSYIPGSFTISLTGCTTATTGTAFYTVNGNVVTLDLPPLTCKGDGGSAKTLTGIPTELRAPTTKVFVTAILDNVTWGIGFGSLSAGIITLYKDASGAVWTPGAAFTFKGASMNYTLN